MPHLKKNLLPLAIMLASSPFAVAAPEAELDTSLRTFYFDRDFQDGATDRTSLTQALRLDGKVHASDSITFGASVFANMKLDGKGNDQFIGTLTDESEGYAKLGQLYADIDLGEVASVRVGRWVTSKALFNDQDNRATPSSSQAIKIEGTTGGVNWFGLYSDRASAKTESDFDKYTDINGDDYGVYVVGAKGSLDNGLNLAVEYGNADDVSEQLYINASYTLENGVLIDFYQYFAEYGDAAAASLQDQDSSLTNVAVRFPVNEDLKVTLSYQGVGGDVGYNTSWGGNDDHYFMTWNSIQYSDFNRQDEDSYQIRADYNTPIQGLSVMARHVEGEFKSGGQDQDHSETNFDAKYAVPSMKGLNLRARYAVVRVDTGGEDINELRLIADYAF